MYCVKQLSRRSCMSGGQQRVAAANVESGKTPEITPARGTSTAHRPVSVGSWRAKLCGKLFENLRSNTRAARELTNF